MPDSPSNPPALTIKKYPNRRFYDSTRSCHVTLEDIHQLIRAGHEVQVIDSKQGVDITAKVLAQIMLEMDSFKLDLFPSGLLHQMIRSNDTLVQEFVETYFSSAFEWFMQTKQTMEHQFRKTVGLARQGDPGEAMLNLWQPLWEMWGLPMPEGSSEPAKTTPQEASDRVVHLQERVERLSQCVENLQGRLAESRKGTPPGN